MKRVLILFLCAMLFCMHASCGNGHKEAITGSKDEVGKDSIKKSVEKYGLKEDYFCKEGNLLYYINRMDNDTIHCRNLDKGESRRITGDSSLGLCIFDGWIYYRNTSDKCRLYRIKPDGSESMRLCEDQTLGFTLLDGFIYYIKGIEQGQIYSVKTDGTEKSILCDDNASQIYAADNRIYYINKSNGNKLASIDLDGKNKLLLSDDPVSRFLIDGSRIYYNNADLGCVMYLENGKIYGKKLEGCNGALIAAVNGSIFYFEDTVSMIDVKSGTVKAFEKLSRAYCITVIGDKLYYFNPSYIENQYRINLTEGREEKYEKEKIWASIAIGDTIIYSVDDGHEIYKEEKNATVSERLATWNPKIAFDTIRVDDEWIYYLAKTDGSISSKFYKMMIDVSDNTEINSVSPSGDYYVRDNYIYYLESNDKFNLYKASLDGGEKQSLSNADYSCSCIKVLDDWIYFVEKKDSNKICRMKTDGSSKQEIARVGINDY